MHTVVEDNAQTPVKVLALWWETTSDTLFVKFKGGVVRTKRQLAGVVCSLYDPLGLFAPIVLKFKLLLQETWNTVDDWDTELPTNLVEHTRVGGRKNI